MAAGFAAGRCTAGVCAGFAMERAAAVVAAGAGTVRTVRCLAAVAQQQAGSMVGRPLCHSLAVGHLLVAVYFHAYLWRPACGAGRAGRARTGGFSGQLLRAADGAVAPLGAAWLAGCGPVRRLLDAGRTGARHTVDRLSWGRLATPMWMGRCLRCLAGWACMAPVR